MNGWIAVLVLAVVAGGAMMFFVRQQRPLWSAVAAALVLGLAGYAWQGSPALEAAPAYAAPAKREAAEALLAMRADMDANYGVAKQWLIMSDSYARDGNYRYAASFLQAGLRKHPRNGDLWAGLGLVLMLAGDGQMSPPAKMAFEKARLFAPLNRAPDYFAGLIELFEGRPAQTLAIWQKLVDGAPDKAIWKPKLESQVNGLKNMLQSVQPSAVSKDK